MNKQKKKKKHKPKRRYLCNLHNCININPMTYQCKLGKCVFNPPLNVPYKDIE